MRHSEYEQHPIEFVNHVSAIGIIRRTLEVFSSNWVSSVAIMLLCTSPALILQIVGMGMQKATTTHLIILSGSILASFFQIPAQAAVMYGTVRYMAGYESSVGENISRGFASMFAALLVGVVTGTVIGLGFLLLVIPGLLLLCRLYVAVPVAVIEEAGVMDSMTRSSYLTEGSRASIFASLFIIVVGNQLLVFFITTFLVTLLQGQNKLFVNQMVPIIIGVPFGALMATMSAVVYAQLRNQKEQIDVEQLSQVFE